MEDVLTEEHYLIAKKNGISRPNVQQRYDDYGWSIERAITEPIKQVKQSPWSKWKDIALKNGIYNELFHVRLKKGWLPEKAATEPITKKKKYNTTTRGKGKYLQTIKH
jgi:hypothetical protein